MGRAVVRDDVKSPIRIRLEEPLEETNERRAVIALNWFGMYLFAMDLQARQQGKIRKRSKFPGNAPSVSRTVIPDHTRASPGSPYHLVRLGRIFSLLAKRCREAFIFSSHGSAFFSAASAPTLRPG
jgi:hypothetical protein